MFGKVGRVLLGMGLIGGIMEGDCSTVTEFSSQNAKMLIKSFTDSLEFKKPTRVFITLLGSLPHIVPGLDTLSENSGLPADKQFFMALFQIFSDPKRKVNNAEADAILESAEKGCQDAREMVSVVLGRRSPSEISDKQKTLMEQMQEIIDESSSEEDSLGVDSEDSDADKIETRTKDGEGVNLVENLDLSYNDQDLLSDPLYVAETARDLSNKFMSYNAEDGMETGSMEYDFNFLLRADYDKDFLSQLLKSIEWKDRNLYERLNSILKEKRDDS